MSKDNILLFNTLEPLLADNHFQVSMISGDAKAHVIDEWQKRFVPKTQDKGEALWHTFSFNRFPHVSETDAVNQFNETYLKQCIIFSTSDYFGINCTTDAPVLLSYERLCQYLDRLPNHVDIYIAQHNFKWTFVITHEKDFGPYYAVAKSVQ